MKKILLFLFSFGFLYSQTNLAINIDDKVYGIIKQAYTKGIIKYLYHVKPYPRWQIIKYLKQIIKSDKITPYEKEIAEEYLKKLSIVYDSKKQTKNLKWGRLYFEDKKHKDINVNFGITNMIKSRTNFNDLHDYYFYFYLNLYISGDLTKYLSYYGDIGFSADRAGYSTFSKYDFTKEWDTFHSDAISNIKDNPNKYHNSPTDDKPVPSFHVNVDISSSFLDHKINARLLRARRDWGMGIGDLTLSNTARPFLGFEVNFSPVKWFNYTHLVGSVSNWEKEPTHWSNNDTKNLSYQKMLAYQKIEFYLGTPYVYLGSNAGIMGAKRFELGYLSPLLHAVIAQSIQADLDNVFGTLELGFIIPYVGFLTFSAFMDEIEFKSATKGANFFTNPRNQIAYQISLQTPIPYVPFGQFSFQYTKIDPFTYSHYPTKFPNFSPLVDTSLSHDNENLGYHLSPNSDEFLFSFQTYPYKNIFTKIAYKYIRHGDNDYDDKQPKIYGNINKPIIYELADKGKYPVQDFTHDGIYDYTHTLSLSFQYDFLSKLPIAVGFDYIFSYTHFVDGQGLKRKALNGQKLESTYMNTIVLWLKFFY